MCSDMAGSVYLRKGFLSLPRELRDEIYAILFTTRHSFLIEKGAKIQLLHSSTIPINRAAIAQVNSSIAKEAKEVLYKCGTFTFYFRPFITPRLLPDDHPFALNVIQNIVIDLNMAEAEKLSPCGTTSGFLSALELLARLCGSGNETFRNRCSFGFHYHRNASFLLGALPHNLSPLVKFKTVEITIISTRDVELRQEIETDAFPIYARMLSLLGPTSGPEKASFECQSMFLHLTYSPRRYLEERKAREEVCKAAAIIGVEEKAKSLIGER